MFCPNCGTKNRDDAKFCTECGTLLHTTKAPMQATGTEPAERPAEQGSSSTTIRMPAVAAANSTEAQTPPVTDGDESSSADAVGKTSVAKPKAPKKRRLWIIPVAVVAALAVTAFVLVKVVGVSIDGGASTKGAIAVMGGTKVGPLTFGGTEMGNTASNYASGGLSVSDDSYDYFYSSTQGGICRAAKDGSSVDVISEREAGWNGWAGHFSLDGSTLFYENTDSENYSNSTTYSVHAINADGSDDRTIYSISSANSAASTIEDVYLYDHMVYVLVSTLDSDTMRTTYGIWTMNEDGSNQHQAGGYTSDRGGGIPFLAKDKVYFCYTPSSSDGSSTSGEVYVQNYDASESSKLYTSDVGGMYGTPFMVGDTIYVEETDNAQGIFNVVAMGLDGSDPHTVFSSTTSESWYNLVAVTHGCLYLSHSDHDALVGSITRAPLDGDDTSEITLGQEYNLFMNDAGDHLLAIGLGGDTGSMGLDVASFDFEGNKLHDYVVDSLDADTDSAQDEGGTTAQTETTAGDTQATEDGGSGTSAKHVVTLDSNGTLHDEAYEYTVTLPSEFTFVDGEVNYSDEPTTGTVGWAWCQEFDTDVEVNLRVDTNNSGETVLDAYDHAKETTPNATYATTKDDWYVISYSQDDKVYYVMTYVEADTIGQMTIEYPETARDAGDAYVEQIQPTFKHNA